MAFKVPIVLHFLLVQWVREPGFEVLHYGKYHVFVVGGCNVYIEAELSIGSGFQGS